MRREGGVVQARLGGAPSTEEKYQWEKKLLEGQALRWKEAWGRGAGSPVAVVASVAMLLLLLRCRLERAHELVNSFIYLLI